MGTGSQERNSQGTTHACDPPLPNWHQSDKDRDGEGPVTARSEVVRWMIYEQTDVMPAVDRVNTGRSSK